MLQRLASLFPQPPPPPVQPAPLVVTVTAAHVLLCVALFLLVRVLRVLARVRGAERALLALASERQISRDVSALGASGVVCWNDPAQRSPAISESESTSEPSPTSSPSDNETELALPSTFKLRSRYLPALSPELVHRLANKAPPWYAAPRACGPVC